MNATAVPATDTIEHPPEKRMSPPDSLATDAGRAITEASSRDPRFAIKSFSVVASLALVCGLVYLLVTHQDVVDRYTGGEAARDWGTQRELNAEMRATLRSIDQRLGRIENKIDAK